MSIFEKVSTAKYLKESDDFAVNRTFLIDEILPKGNVCLMVGPEKSFKSSVTQDMASAITNGEDFAGLKTYKNNVLIIQNENSRFTEHQRLKGSARESSDNLFFLHGGLFKLDEWVVEYDPVTRKKKEYNPFLRELYTFIKEKNISFVILDPLKDMLQEEETLNNNPLMNKCLSGITRLKLKLEEADDMLVSFMIVAHARKEVGSQSIDDKDFRVRPNQVLGATSIPAWYEVAFTMSPKINRKTKGEYSIMKVKARNFSWNHERLFGYVGESFVHVDPSKKEKPLYVKEKEKELNEELVEKSLENIDEQHGDE